MNKALRTRALTSELLRFNVRGRRPNLNKVWLQYALLLAVYALVFAVWQAEPLPLHVYAAGVLVAAICLFPIVFWYARGQQGAPMFELICLAYGVQYSLPLYLQPNQIVAFNSRTVRFAWDDTFRTLLLVVLGVSSMIVVYYTTAHSRRLQKLPRVNLQLDPNRRPVYLAGALFFGLGTVVLQSLGNSPAALSPLGIAVRLLTVQFYIALILIAYRVYAPDQQRPGWSVSLYTCVGVATLLGLSSGFLQVALIPLALVFVVRWHARRRLPLRLLAVGLLIFLVLNSVKTQYRAQVWYGGTNFGVLDRATTWLDSGQQAVSQTFTGDVLANAHDRLQPSLARLDLLHVFVLVESSTPSSVPYYHGSTYTSLLSTWIPRAVWPDKPTAHAGIDAMAVDYGLLLPFQLSSTKIGVGHLAEAYGNFGPLGVLLIMALQGVFFGIINWAFNGPESEGGRAVYVAVLIFFLNGIGSGTALMFGNILQDFLPSALVLRLFSGRGKKSEDRVRAKSQTRRRERGSPARVPLSPSRDQPG